MEFFRKNENRQNKATRRLSMGRKTKKAFVVYAALVCCMVFGATATLAVNDPTAVVNNLSNFIFGLTKAVRMTMLGFGIIWVGLSLKSHDPSRGVNGFLTLVGGIMITFVKEVLTFIIG